jgi:hypothetical protein
MSGKLGGEMDIQQPMTLVGQGLHVDTETVAKLFRIDEATLHKWDSGGVPAGVAEKLNTVLEIAALLNAKLRPERIGAVVERRAEAFHGLSMVEMIRRDNQAELLAELQRSFDYSVLA